MRTNPASGSRGRVSKPRNPVSTKPTSARQLATLPNQAPIYTTSRQFECILRDVEHEFQKIIDVTNKDRDCAHQALIDLRSKYKKDLGDLKSKYEQIIANLQTKHDHLQAKHEHLSRAHCWLTGQMDSVKRYHKCDGCAIISGDVRPAPCSHRVCGKCTKGDPGVVPGNDTPRCRACLVNPNQICT